MFEYISCRMKTWTVAVTLTLLIALSNGLPVPEETSSASTSSIEDGSKSPSVSSRIYLVFTTIPYLPFYLGTGAHPIFHSRFFLSVKS